MEETLEYELIDIDFGYELPDEKPAIVSEDGPQKEQTHAIEYDADGIPMGKTKEESLIRRKFIYDFIQSWRAQHNEDPRIYNEHLKEYIKVNQVFMLESVGHAAYSYLSTKAVLKMEEVMAKALYVGQTNAKEGNSKQKAFQKMIVMRYKSDDLGTVKMTVGVRNRTKEKVEYSITVPDPTKPFIDSELKSSSKDKKRKKHHK